MVMDCHTWCVETRHALPIRDCDAFVVFDDARCLRTDMKMRQGARAGITAGTS
jgi:hypothetical protein